ncbi:MAG TPA: SET domain-containing protein-lysine N-methyltransferase [Verrucomicrobiae bacterium]|nr:SET domain-containing protein-lysine N-methyltransferase [Verrucomicrobiae bacterium]
MLGTAFVTQQFEPIPCEWLRFSSSRIHGTGGFAIQEIPPGTRIIEYEGERITKSESLRRCESGNQFIFALNDREDLDGNIPANPARFLNHSCSPNSEAVLEEGRIWIVSTRGISRGEEVTFNYGFDLIDYREHPCHCGARNCVGYIVAEEFFDCVPPRSTACEEEFHWHRAAG